LRFNIETERETDGRWIAEIPEIPGAMAYGKTEDEAKANAYARAWNPIADARGDRAAEAVVNGKRAQS
jgi:hypothetical protein